MQEDQIYEIQDYMTEYQELLRQERCKNRKLLDQLAMQSAASPAATDDSIRPLEDDDAESDGESSLLDRATGNEPTEAPEPSDDAHETDDDGGLPEIDLGEPSLPEIDLGEPLPADELESIDPGGAAPEELPSGDLGSLSQASATGAAADMDADVREAVFAPPPQPVEPAESCVLYAEQMPVETHASADVEEGEVAQIGLMAIVEPLTATGASGAFAGEVSLMLVDPIAEQEDWEIARWDYTLEEVEQAWRDGSRRVLDLPLATPVSTPVGRPLELWIRMVPQHGKAKLLCSTAITLADPVRLVGIPVSGGASRTLSGAVSSGWNAADSLRPAPEGNPKREPTTWQAATTLPPMAIAKAEAKLSRPAKTAKPPGQAKPWSPQR